MPVDLHAAIEEWALNGSVLRTVLGPDAPYPISLDSTPVTGHLLHGGALESVTLAEILADHRVRVVYQDAHRSRVLDDAQVLFKANELPAVFAGEAAWLPGCPRGCIPWLTVLPLSIVVCSHSSRCAPAPP